MDFDDFISMGDGPSKHWRELALQHGITVEVVAMLHRQAWDMITDPPNRKYIGILLDSLIQEYLKKS